MSQQAEEITRESSPAMHLDGGDVSEKISKVLHPLPAEPLDDKLGIQEVWDALYTTLDMDEYKKMQEHENVLSLLLECGDPAMSHLKTKTKTFTGSNSHKQAAEVHNVLAILYKKKGNEKLCNFHKLKAGETLGPDEYLYSMQHLSKWFWEYTDS